MTCPYCGSDIPSGSTYCDSCKSVIGDDAVKTESRSGEGGARKARRDRYRGHEMGWYNILIYFALFAFAAFNLVRGISTIILNLMEKTEMTGFIAAEVIFGVLLIAVAPFAIFVRVRLAYLKKGAPAALYALVVFFALISVYRLAAVLISLSGVEIAYVEQKDLLVSLTESLIRDVIISVVFAAVFLITNVPYFSKRKALFVR